MAKRKTQPEIVIYECWSSGQTLEDILLRLLLNKQVINRKQPL